MAHGNGRPQDTSMPLSPTPIQGPMPQSASHYLNQNAFTSPCPLLPPLPTQYTSTTFQHAYMRPPPHLSQPTYMPRDLPPHLSRPISAPQPYYDHSRPYSRLAQPQFPPPNIHTPINHTTATAIPLPYVDTF